MRRFITQIIMNRGMSKFLFCWIVMNHCNERDREI